MFCRKQKISGKENMLCDNYIIIAKHLQFLFEGQLSNPSIRYFLEYRNNCITICVIDVSFYIIA